MKYKCCVNMPIFDFDKSTKIIDICVPPELHLMLGVANRIYKDLELKHPTIAELFTSRIGLSKMKQFGFNGKACRKLMKSFHLLHFLFENNPEETVQVDINDERSSQTCDDLSNKESEDDIDTESEDMTDTDSEEDETDVTNLEKYPHVVALKNLFHLVEVCFGNQFVPENVEHVIKSFEQAWIILGIKNTVKSQPHNISSYSFFYFRKKQEFRVLLRAEQ